jgi:hypothetical protein
MCYDISFKARLGKIMQDNPGIDVAPSLPQDEDVLLHVQAQAHRTAGRIVLNSL